MERILASSSPEVLVWLAKHLCGFPEVPVIFEASFACGAVGKIGDKREFKNNGFIARAPEELEERAKEALKVSGINRARVRVFNEGVS
ncbi:MAG: hypothetical protein WDZ90_00240 [Candidatus Paceibacterota bacterium]